MKKIFRKLHLWLSVPFGIFITLICFSGAMLVFEREITEACRRDLYFVEKVGESPLPLDRLMDGVAATLPDSVSITGVTISPDAGRAWQVGLSAPRRASLYVDQYTGEIKGRNVRLPFYDTMFHLHRWMMGSSSGFGKTLVGISTLAFVVILVTGLLMWLTNRNKPLAKSLKISFTKGWPRFWHDLHVAGGIYATVFLLAIALTGMTWSFAWYRTGFYKAFGVESSAEGGHGSRGGQTAGNRGEGRGKGENSGEGRDEHAAGEGRAVRESRETVGVSEARGEERAVRAERAGHFERGSAAGDSSDRRHRRGGEGRGHDGQGRAERRFPRSPYAQWQKVYETLAQSNPGFRQITVSDGSASVVPAGRMSLRSGDRFEFDRRGEITSAEPYSGQERSVKVRSGVYMVHVGSWGGMFTRILTFIAVLLGATLPLTGYYLWIRRLVKGHPHHRREE